MKLSILIPTLPERINKYNDLINSINIQIKKLKCFNDLEIISDDRDRSITTGEKRNDLINASKGLYTVFIDDDDKISTDYLELILNAIKTNPDVITFKGYMTTNKANRRDFIIKLHSNYETVNGIYYRFPNHLCPIKRDLIKNVKFENITYLEDFKWASKIKELNLLKTECHINKDLYYYDFIEKK